MADLLENVFVVVFGAALVAVGGFFLVVTVLGHLSEMRSDFRGEEGRITLSGVVHGLLIIGACGFGLMFLTLAIGLSPAVPVAMMGAGIIGVVIGAIASMLPDRTWKPRQSKTEENQNRTRELRDPAYRYVPRSKSQPAQRKDESASVEVEGIPRWTADIEPPIYREVSVRLPAGAGGAYDQLDFFAKTPRYLLIFSGALVGPETEDLPFQNIVLQECDDGRFEVIHSRDHEMVSLKGDRKLRRDTFV